MPSAWDHRADKDLLLAIIDTGDLSHINWPNIARAMQAKAYTFTHEACRQHYQKLRREAKNGNSSTPATPSTANGTGKDKSTKATTGAKRGPKGKAGVTTPGSSFGMNGLGMNGNDTDLEDDEEIAFRNAMNETPLKKRKIKAESQDAGSDGFEIINSPVAANGNGFAAGFANGHANGHGFANVNGNGFTATNGHSNGQATIIKDEPVSIFGGYNAQNAARFKVEEVDPVNGSYRGGASRPVDVDAVDEDVYEA